MYLYSLTGLVISHDAVNQRSLDISYFLMFLIGMTCGITNQGVCAPGETKWVFLRNTFNKLLGFVEAS